MRMPGFSKSRLERLHDVLAGYVERQELPGLVALVSHHDDLHIETIGTLSFGDTTPMEHDTIFRIASITKPITAVAAMTLLEESKLRLDDAVDDWLPELANRRVLRSIASELDDTVPALRSITVRDLMTYRMGFGSVMAMPGTYPIQTPIRDLRIGGDGPPRPLDPPPPDEWLRRLGTLPLMAQPGEQWLYNVSADVLGVLIARVSGKTLGEFMRERIFEPLGMKDTRFHVFAEDLGRLPAMYYREQQTGRLELFDGVTDSEFATTPPFESGAGGLVSTIDDYFSFCRMMLNRGQHGRDQILSRASVELMTAPHVTREQMGGADIFFGSYRSWGFGMAVDTARHDIFNTPGRFGWDGGYGTSAYTDPAESMIGVLFTQRMMESPQAPTLFVDFWTQAYAAMT